jgi:hypothetical protein
MTGQKRKLDPLGAANFTFGSRKMLAFKSTAGTRRSNEPAELPLNEFGKHDCRPVLQIGAYDLYSYWQPRRRASDRHRGRGQAGWCGESRPDDQRQIGMGFAVNLDEPILLVGRLVVRESRNRARRTEDDVELIDCTRKRPRAISAAIQS